ncbi:gluconokinase [Mesorhizobium sp. ZMM04-5]|uniref:Gluconokinase n=1 Tax=Mesorhizobium marinum TaxID=3228790 RepID=A0ABV3QXF6_9HYPH
MQEPISSRALEAPAAIVVMGVSGSGKTVIGTALAAALGVHFVEGDHFHPPENISRMSAGLPLRDQDRWGWLDAIAGRIADAQRRGEGLVVACSALKRVYRDRLCKMGGRVRFVFLDIGRDVAAARVAMRRDHFMPASLTDSQFADLEPPAADEEAIRLDASQEVSDVVAAARALLADRSHMPTAAAPKV